MDAWRPRKRQRSLWSLLLAEIQSSLQIHLFQIYFWSESQIFGGNPKIFQGDSFMPSSNKNSANFLTVWGFKIDA